MALALGSAAAVLPAAIELAVGETTASIPATVDVFAVGMPVLGAAIVCDVDDALIASRVDRTACSSERALAPLPASPGTAFATRCAGALEHVLAREAAPAKRPPSPAPAPARTPARKSVPARA